MATAHIVYQGELRTNCTHLQSGTHIITDAPTDNHGKGEAFSPTDLVAVALGACVITTMGIVADRDGLDISGTTIEVTKHMESNPRRIAAIEVILNIPATNLTNDQKQKLENTGRTCPVEKSLHPDMVRNFTFNFI
ncbi:MAG: OsmC family peroxiredoxin [Chitinophagia bacterium]|nr:OsmC family peroxiredoxin [Chitinophagia bacterium]